MKSYFSKFDCYILDRSVAKESNSTTCTTNGGLVSIKSEKIYFVINNNKHKKSFFLCLSTCVFVSV